MSFNAKLIDFLKTDQRFVEDEGELTSAGGQAQKRAFFGERL